MKSLAASTKSKKKSKKKKIKQEKEGLNHFAISRHLSLRAGRLGT
jgi:hypothetical protein